MWIGLIITPVFLVGTVFFLTGMEARKNRLASLKRLFNEEDHSPDEDAAYHRVALSDPYIYLKLLGLGFTAFAVLFLLTAIKIVLATAISLTIVLLVWQAYDMYRLKKMGMLEEQLADMIDLMVSGLQAGSSAVKAMEISLQETEQPLKKILSDVLARLRFGEAADRVFTIFAKRVPVESFKVFALTMSVHWGTGGRLVPLLATVSKVIRDKVEVNRQIRLQSAQSRLSAVIILIITYAIAVTVWNANPVMTKSFVNSVTGGWLISAAVFLQAFGIFWIAQLTKVKY